jgi:pyrimidine-specific ribonucleoside hydrolase
MITTALCLLLLAQGDGGGHAPPPGLHPTTLLRYPHEPSAFREDVAVWVDTIVARHGLEEWHAVMLTHELHRHMGIYNIVGAKMGVRAREILGASREDLRVESFIGRTLPLSCMNDGLQVGTGATLGRGTITLDPVAEEPRARFRCAAGAVELRLRPAVQEAIRADIRRLSREHTYGSAPYFAAVRTLSMRYWLDLDRAAIFEETRLP